MARWKALRYLAVVSMPSLPPQWLFRPVSNQLPSPPSRTMNFLEPLLESSPLGGACRRYPGTTRYLEVGRDWKERRWLPRGRSPTFTGFVAPAGDRSAVFNAPNHQQTAVVPLGTSLFPTTSTVHQHQAPPGPSFFVPSWWSMGASGSSSSL